MNSFYYSKYKKYKEKYKNLLGGSEDCGCGSMFCEICAQKQPSYTKQPSSTKQQSDMKPSGKKQPSGTKKKQQSDEPNRLTINIIKLDGTTIKITDLVNPQIIAIKRFISEEEGIDVDDITLLDSNGVLPDNHTVTHNIDLQMIVDQISGTFEIVTFGRPLTNVYGSLQDGWDGAADYIFNLTDGTRIKCISKLLYIHHGRGSVSTKLDWDIVPLPTNKKIIKAMIKILEDAGAKLLPDGTGRYKKSDITAINSLFTKLINL